MTRIVAGSAKGHKLLVPKSGTRPTSERVREALFSRLAHYGYLDGCIVLDLFAGSGALALEALSRGALSATCVDASAGAAKVIRANATALGVKLDVVNQKVQTYLALAAEAEMSNPAEQEKKNAQKFDLVFIDPPYDFGEDTLEETLYLLHPLLKHDAMVVVERSSRAPEPSWPEFLVLDDVRKWGDTRVWSAVCGANFTEAN